MVPMCGKGCDRAALTPKSHAPLMTMLMVFTSVSSRHAHCVKVQDEHVAAPGLVTAW
jgi:hypothetical protein